MTTSAPIRRAAPDDARALAALGAETFVATFGHLYTEADLRAFLAKSHSVTLYECLLADPAYAIWLAEEGGVAVGYAVAGPCTLPVPGLAEGAAPHAGELARLYLRSSHQGRGLGRELLAVALDWLEGRYGAIYLSVYAHNVGAQRLYARHGFTKLCEYEYMVGEHADPEWIMQRVSRGAAGGT